MPDPPPVEHDLHFRNVELHSLGRKEYGTLVLSKHHFVFRYLPGAKHGDKSLSSPANGRPKEMWMPYPLINHCILPHAPFETGKQPAIRIRLKDFRMMALHFHPSPATTPPDESARQCFYSLRSRCCVDDVRRFHAFQFSPPKEEMAVSAVEYDARREYARMGIGGKAAAGPGAAWRISDINHDYSYSATYPSVLCVPRTVSDNMLKYGGAFRSRSRIPCLSYLHSNGGSITRSSQPMVGVQSRRNPQDERLVSAIFSSHTPSRDATSSVITSSLDATAEPVSTPHTVVLESAMSSLHISQSETTLDEVAEGKPTAKAKVYGSTRRNLIVDARPKINALANRATGGGIEDVANYRGTSDVPVEKVFLNIANIHVMRASLEKVVDSFANSDYIKMKPDQEALRKSGWLGHIAGMLEGAEMVARVVGLGGSHVLVHCSDGWDRTAQISGLAQVMLDPHTRTLAGFISLIQKEFLSFGHKFRDRDGIEGSEKWFEIENERVIPSRTGDGTSEAGSLNNLGAKALSGAKNWFEKNRGSIFRQQNSSRDNVSDQGPSSRPPSPPPNPLLHSPPASTGKEEKTHRKSEKEVSPIFHQFLEGVYQLMHPNPNAFEFNEHLLCRLFYHVYSCQYGEFLFNTEKERREYKDQAGSVWSHFLSREKEFINPDYVAQVEDPLLFPTRAGADREIEVKWWYRLFKREDGEMNVPRALVVSHPPHASVDSSSTASLEETPVVVGTSSPTSGGLKSALSAPNFKSMSDSLNGASSWMGLGSKNAGAAATTINPEPTTPTAQRNTTAPPEARHEETDDIVQGKVPKSDEGQEPVAEEYEGDPLGVSAESTPMKTAATTARSRGLDFAAFASQNAFRD
ncbi:protein-tyrosine phosphatase-like protein [Neohortaea acidophila]|uniref:Protein-tyrosine phosphatase-like protein n=1 Tax=Neohortaea acidophila TaxID=245834 RepID=A0A6A6PI93_9PEZI|nr:protein-tyrosine phosphatase-like protein [Neohortaea acidophila]KAF2478977.1 protein-tyrosine phosphatase-like protein [Neohortaea acidophila]